MQGTQQQGCGKGSLDQSAPASDGPPPRRRGIRHSPSLVLAPASTVPSRSKYDHDAAGTGGEDAATGCEAHFVILLLLSAGREVPKLPGIACEASFEHCPDPGHQLPIAQLRHGNYIHPEA